MNNGQTEVMAEKHFIEVENGEEVAAVHHKSDSNKWIFFCHGFGSDKEGSYIKRCETAVENGFNAVRFDFRGNNESDGDFIEQDLSSRIHDLESVVSYFQPERYVLFGMSFGGKVVFHSIDRLDPLALVGKSPVTFNEIMDKFKAVVEEKGEYTHFGDKTIDERFVHDLEDYRFSEVAGNIEVPVLIFHGREDQTVHPKYSLEAAEKIQTDTSIELFRGEKHKMTEKANRKLLETMFEWLNRI